MARILTDIYHKAASRSVFNQNFTSKKHAVTIEFALLFRHSVLSPLLSKQIKRRSPLFNTLFGNLSSYRRYVHFNDGIIDGKLCNLESMSHLKQLVPLQNI